MTVQRSRDVHIWRLTANNAMTRMAIHAKLHGNYMFIFHMNNHELPPNSTLIIYFTASGEDLFDLNRFERFPAVGCPVWHL